MQRFCDITLSLIVLVVLTPLFLIIIIILKCTGEGEVFYRQNRVGIEGKLFGVFKFATMVKNSSKMGTGYITTKNDPRVLPFGRFLRKSKINELPQIINVLIGDMSVVGPRPQVQKHFDLYPEHVKTKIAKVKPGLTGIGSIIFRDEENILEQNKSMSYDDCYARLIAPYKGDLELWYISRKNIYLYVILIFLTAWVVFFPKSRLYEKVLLDLPEPKSNLNL